MGHDPRVRAHGDLHPGLVGPGDALPMDLHGLSSLAQAVLGHAAVGALPGLQDGQGGEEGGHQEGAVLQHQVDGLVVQEDAVLDGVDPGPDCVLDPLCSLGMGHDLDSPAEAAFLDHDPQLLLGELGEFRVVRGAEDAAGGADLDHLRAGPQDLPHLLAHLLHAVAEAAGVARVGREEVQGVAGEHPAVPVAAGGGEDGDADLHAGAQDQPLLHGLLHAHVRAPGVPHAGDAGLHRAAHVVDGLVEVEREGRGQQLGDVDPLQHEVHVGVDEAGEDGAALGVDLGDRAIGLGQLAAGAGGQDAVVLDEHRAVLDGGCAGAVDECAVVDQDGAHGKAPGVGGGNVWGNEGTWVV